MSLGQSLIHFFSAFPPGLLKASRISLPYFMMTTRQPAARNRRSIRRNSLSLTTPSRLWRL